MKKLIELLSRWLWTGPTKGWLQLGMILALSVAASQACSDYEDGVLLGAVGLLIGFTAKPGLQAGRGMVCDRHVPLDSWPPGDLESALARPGRGPGGERVAPVHGDWE